MLDPNLIKKVKCHEGFRSIPYTDTTGNLTVGYGRNLSKNGVRQAEAEFMLKNDLDYATAEINALSWAKKLDPIRKDVLVELNFNIGLGKLLGFKWMIKALHASDYEKAAVELLDSLWARQVGEERSNDMANRLRTGTY